ncbi:MAG: hypothetical protein U5J82_05310 [Desulfobacterales bacterium]|nr:hypothetical protein [Desulfobacterales bacterium]
MGAAAGAVVLNLALFALTPRLVQRPAEVPVFEQLRGQHQRHSPEEEEWVARDAEDTAPTAGGVSPAGASPPWSHTRFALDFELNPRLPAGPVAVALPAVAPVKPDMAGLGELFAAGDLGCTADGDFPHSAGLPPPCQAAGHQRVGAGALRGPRSTAGVTDITIEESQPAGVFDVSVVRSVAGWRFKPGTVAGMPVKPGPKPPSGSSWNSREPDWRTPPCNALSDQTCFRQSAGNRHGLLAGVVLAVLVVLTVRPAWQPASICPSRPGWRWPRPPGLIQDKAYG